MSVVEFFNTMTVSNMNMESKSFQFAFEIAKVHDGFIGSVVLEPVIINDYGQIIQLKMSS